MNDTTTPSQKYRRLPGRGTSVASYITLHQGADHLLQVTTTGFTETYKRFFFRDIQAITIRWTGRRNTYSAVLGALALLFAFPGALALPGSGATAAVLFVIAGCFIAGLLVNVALGPTCICEIKTAVQTERLPGLNRVRRAQKFLDHLKPLLDAAQGTLPPERLSALLTETWRAAAFEAAHAANAAPAAAPAASPGVVPESTLPPIAPAP